MTASMIALIDRVIVWTGKAMALLVIPMMLLVFANAVLRYVFGMGSVWMQEAVIYCFVVLMTGLSGWALTTNEHVRVDIFYSALSSRRQAMVDMAGASLLMAPFLWVMWTHSWPYVMRSWRIGERSMELSGIPLVWALKTFLLVFVAVTALAGVAFVLRAALRLAGRME